MVVYEGTYSARCLGTWFEVDEVQSRIMHRSGNLGPAIILFGRRFTISEESVVSALVLRIRKHILTLLL